jgi:microcystin-dependent protein
MEPIIGQIMMFAGKFAPKGWAICDGKILPIREYAALFSIIGTTYGGDGRTSFALPDLRGRVPVHQGKGPGLTPRDMGEKGGLENEVLSVSQLPAHNHQGNGTIRVNNSDDKSTHSNPEGKIISVLNNQTLGFADSHNATMQDNCVQVYTNVVGGSIPVDKIQPYLTVNFIIALEGTFPQRS